MFYCVFIEFLKYHIGMLGEANMSVVYYLVLFHVHLQNTVQNEELVVLSSSSDSESSTSSTLYYCFTV